MNKRLVGLIVFAVAVSGIASLLVYRVLASRLTSTAPATEGQVVVVARDVKMGALVRPEDVKLAAWRGQIPSQAFTSIDKIDGRSAMIALHPGDLLLDNMMTPKGSGVGLASRIPDGKRAVAVRVNEVVGLAGFVLPGMHVDVIACGVPPGKEKDSIGTQSRTVLQNIEVLSAGQKIEHDVEGKPETVQVVNLLVTPEQAETMALAGNETKVQLALRNPNDPGTPEVHGTATADLFNARPAAAEPRKAGPRVARAFAGPARPVMEKVAVPITMEIIIGSKRQDTKVGQTIEERPKEERAR